jgi:hypothetical protein
VPVLTGGPFRVCQLAPETRAVGRRELRDLGDQRIVRVLLVVRADQVRRCDGEHFRQNEEQTKVESLLVVFNARKRRRADVSLSGYIGQRQTTRLSCLAKSFANHLHGL